MNTKRLYENENAIAPAIALVLTILAVAIGAGVVIAAYQLTQKPDVTYNITDAGVALAGIDTNVIYIIGAIVLVMGFIWLMGRKK